MEVKVLFNSSKKVSPTIGTINIGKYTIEPLPDPSRPSNSATTSYLLRFTDEMRAIDGGTSQPEMEARLFLSFLSLSLGSRITVSSMMINSVNVPNPSPAPPYSHYWATVEHVHEFTALFSKVSECDAELARQFLRACEVYQTAVTLVGENNTLACFLFSIAIECLSNRYGRGSGHCAKFVDFILSYYPDCKELGDETDFKGLLKEIYYRHRSGFTHGGKPIPDAATLADRLGRVYVRNMLDGKEIITPGLNWFEKVVRTTITAFVLAQSSSAGDKKDRFKDISLEFGKVMLKAARNLAAHEIVSGSDFHLD
jgi:hypothetical protein